MLNLQAAVPRQGKEKRTVAFQTIAIEPWKRKSDLKSMYKQYKMVHRLGTSRCRVDLIIMFGFGCVWAFEFIFHHRRRQEMKTGVKISVSSLFSFQSPF